MTQYKHFVIKNQPKEGYNMDLSSPGSTFELKTDTINLSKVEPNHLLLKICYLSNDPAQTFWNYSNLGKDYGGQVPVGGEAASRGIGKVLKSGSPEYKEGDYVYTMTGWTEYADIDIATSKIDKLDSTGEFEPSKIPLEFQLGLFGLTGLTAYVGLFEIGKLREKNVKEMTMLITGAAGAVGSVAVQIAANVMGVGKVIAVAGGAEKCQWVQSLAPGKNVITVDYKDPEFKQNFAAAVGEKRINFIFENVGGDIMDYALDFLELYAIIVYSGTISTYMGGHKRAFYKLPYFSSKRMTISGFIVSDFKHKYPEYKAEMVSWYHKKLITENSTTMSAEGEDFVKIPQIWYGLFTGINKGKLVTKVSDL